MRLKLFLLSFLSLFIFTSFSYTVAKETYSKFDFDTTVKLQDRIPRTFDEFFSYFSLLGSVEATATFCVLLAIIFLIRGKLLGFLGWLMIIPATLGELFGKLVLFHPAPPVFLHRTLLPTGLPSFYVHTDFSYPSGHMTRTIFIITILIIWVFVSQRNILIKFISLAMLIGLTFAMGITRVYLGEHWSSDVIGGSFLGAGMGFFASGLIFKNKKTNIP
ncbi:MAG: phosphatase PAP2 family protein [Patescibacteria group bacterium]